MTATSTSGLGTNTKDGGLARNLGLVALVGLGLGYMTPTVIFDTFGTVSETTAGAVPSAYLAALVVMALTALSYGKLVMAFPSAGSAYTYVRETMHPNLGFMVGWSSLLDYLLLPMVNALIIKLYVEQMLPQVPSWLVVLVYAVCTTTLVAITMRGTSRVNLVLLVTAVVVMAAFVVIASYQLLQGEGAGTLVSGRAFAGPETTLPLVLTGATVVCFSFIGFDAVTMYAEEAKSPKIMPRAIMLTVLLGGAIFLVAAYVTQLRFPDNTPFGEFTDDPLPQIARIVGGPAFQAVLVGAAFMATVASGLASHASVSRMLLVMGRNGALPGKALRWVNPRTHTPVVNIIIVGAVCLLAVDLSLELVSAFINFGALVAFTFVNASVIAHFAIRRRELRTPREWIVNAVVPGIATLLTALLWTQLHSDALIAGGIWAAIGLTYLIVYTRGFRRPMASLEE
ncbi:putrescine:proton symporter, AAT family [Quadrisphaera granulorum]|uniref:Putrescine:proton symporter (AAT family) n=1 Tax=Quadrisphaera granulorum TaxID=317664 RepID=A0A315ZSP1_9ACTN|nr:APC family permease [Quadrisphaera granulorum]PWJ48329.1 putrescine:proton symporter (AAT family) [Quadrisphaera granulorum]SZE98490.1 putrescine:proton symporter, AAT family [Quadrisphaera granulorum]